MKSCQVIISTLVALAGIQIGSAAPTMFNYQGRLMLDEQPANGSSVMTFTLYDAATDGNARYADTQTVAVVDGLYSVMIGASNAVGLANALTNSALYLEIKVGSDTLTPRNRIGSVPYALSAASYTIAAGAIGATELATDAVESAKIKDAAVTTAKIADLGVTEGKINDLAVTEGKIGALAVTEGKIGALAVTEGKIGALAVAEGKIANSAITTNKIGTGAVIAAKIAADAVTETKIADSAITTNKIGTGAVIAAKIAADAVTTVKILDANITTAKIADGNITEAKLDTDSVITIKLANNAVTSQKTKTTVTAALATDTTLAINNLGLVLADASSLTTPQALTVTLPAASGAYGWTYTVKKIDAVTDNSVVVDGNGAETIDGHPGITNSALNSFVTVTCNGTNWYVIGQ